MKTSCKQSGLESWWCWGEKGMGTHVKVSVWYLYGMTANWESVAIEKREIQD